MAKILKRSPHFASHVAHGAKSFFDFAGWEMPDYFSSLEEEVTACREAAVLFDGHQMGEIHLKGKDAHKAVQTICAADIKAEPGRCFYSSLCNEDGGIVDDLVVLCLAPDHYLLTAAAFNVTKTPGWIEGHVAGMDVKVDDQTNGTTIIELQGPKSRDVLRTITDVDISNRALPYFRFVRGKVAGIDCLIARLGVTGELGYEIIYDPAYAYTMYDGLVDAGKDAGWRCAATRRWAFSAWRRSITSTPGKSTRPPTRSKPASAPTSGSTRGISSGATPFSGSGTRGSRGSSSAMWWTAPRSWFPPERRSRWRARTWARRPWPPTVRP